MSSPTSAKTNPLPPNLHMELLSLRRLREAVRQYRDGYMMDQIKSPRNCVNDEHHDIAVEIDEALKESLKHR